MAAAQPPVDERFALHPLDGDERSTFAQIAAVGARVLVLPTHCMDARGGATGFRAVSPASKTVGSAAFSPSMFFGVAAAECQATAQDVARLIATAGECQARLEALVAELRGAAAARPTASLQCIPRDMHGILQDATTTASVRSNSRRAVDNTDWVPEPPSLLGVYQAHVRSASGERRHAVFIACESGCQRAANEYYNMMLDLGEQATLGEAVECEETWWLQKASSRARNLIMFQAAAALGLTPRAAVVDVHAQTERRVMTPVCETLTHDISRARDNAVQILNHAVDTTRVQNGIIVKMHPAEGLWLFRGAPRAVSGSAFGGMFGDAAQCPVFPTHTIETDDRRRPGIVSGAARRRYLHFNNSFLQHLQVMGWDRDYGIVELVPIAVVHAGVAEPER